jgi:CubicO group peptidase (beta-lactamase class C family)
MSVTKRKFIEFSALGFPATWKVLHEGLDQGVAPGFVVGVWKKTEPRVMCAGAFGQRRTIPSELPMTCETIFDLASLSKVMATGCLAAVLVERGWLDWDTSVSAIFSGYGFPQVKVRHLLSHTSGYAAWHPIWSELHHQLVRDSFHPLYRVPIQTRQEAARKLVLSLPPQVPVESRALYSDLSFLILGFILEEITQMPLDAAVEKFVWQPMGIRQAFYKRVNQAPQDALDESVAATENCFWRGGLLQGQVHDDNCWAMGGYAGHAGVFGTVQDVLHFGKSLMEGFLSSDILRAIWTPVEKPQGCTRTLGWDTSSVEGSSTGGAFSKQSVGHLGYVGTSLWIDPVAGLVVTLLSNRVHPSRENIKIQAFRPRFHRAIRLDLKLNGSQSG